MAVPAGWIEIASGVTVETVVLANMVIDSGGANEDPDDPALGIAYFTLGGWYFENFTDVDSIDFRMFPGSGDPGPYTLQSQAAPAPTPLVDDTDPVNYWNDVTFTQTYAGLFLGVTIEIDSEGDRILRYALFADSNTTRTTIAGGQTRVVNPWSSVLDVSDNLDLDIQWVGPLEETWDILEGQGSTYRSDPFPYYRFSGLQAQTEAVDFSDAPFIREVGYISPYLTDVTPDPFQPAFTVTFGAPRILAADVDVADAGGSGLGADAELRLGANDQFSEGTLVSSFVTPESGTHLYRTVSWIVQPVPAGRFRIDLADAWMAAQSPVVPLEEDGVPLRGMLPESPSSAPNVWQPATVTLAGSVNVLNSANIWEEHSGDVDVGGAGGLQWTVNAAGSAVRRTLFEKWRHWSDDGHPDFRADGFRITRHDYVALPAQDAWGWGSYAYLDITIDAPAAGTMTMVIEGVNANFTFHTGNFLAQQLYTVSYAVPVAAGAQTVRVDLMFPVEGGPFYHERVDTIRFEGLAAGDWTLTSLALVADQNGYLKADYSGVIGIWHAQDGAAPMMLWGGNPFLSGFQGRAKRDEDFPEAASETFALGGAIPTRNINGFGGTSERTLSEMLEDLNRIEGFTVTQDESGIDDGLTDGSNTISTVREAAWIQPHHPALRLTPDVAATLDASPLLRYLQIPPGMGDSVTPYFQLYARKILGGTLEALVATPDGTRSPSGRTLQAARTDTGATVATGQTDASGFVQVAVPCDGSRIYRLESG